MQIEIEEEERPHSEEEGEEVDSRMRQTTTKTGKSAQVGIESYE